MSTSVAGGRRIDVGRRLYVAQVQRHVGGDRWTPETDLTEIAVNASGDSVRQVGIDFALDRLPEGDDWRVLVWEPAMVGQLPAARITAADIKRTTASAPPVKRSGKKSISPRVHGPVSEVVEKVRPSESLLGKRILVSRDRNNKVGAGSEWHAANYPAPGTEAARVRSFSTLDVRGQRTLILNTTHGEVRLPERGSVIPA